MRKVSPDIEGCCTHPHLPLNYARVQDQVISLLVTFDITEHNTGELFDLTFFKL